MSNNWKHPLGIIIFILCTSPLPAQNSKKHHYPSIGEVCPDLYLTEVRYLLRPSTKISDFRGKWLILDLWNRYCGECIGSFLGTDSLQGEFRDNVQFLLVGYTGSRFYPAHGPDEAGIKSEYESTKKRLRLSLPIAYDSTLFEKFGVGGCPYIIVIDPKGVIRAITNKVTAQNLADFIAGENPRLPVHMNRDQEKAFILKQKQAGN